MSKYTPESDWDREEREIKAQALKNTRLVMAAPELLEALNKFARMNTQAEWPDDLNNAIIDARTAIAKVTGGEG